MMAQELKNQQNDDPSTFNHQFTDVNGIRLHYVEEGSGPLVIMLHGFPFLWYLWRHQIRAVAAAGFRVVVPDMRGYGQSDCPSEVSDYDMSRLVGDIVGLMKALNEASAVLVGQDWGSPIIYNAALMRPDLFRGILMMCAPPSARTPMRPSVAMARTYGDKGLVFYVDYLTSANGQREITNNLRDYLLASYFSTSASSSENDKFRWVLPAGEETFSDTLFRAPKELPPFLSRRALDYYVENFERTGITPATNYYACIDRNWEITSFLDGAIVPHPALFVYGEKDWSTETQCGIDRQGPALRALPNNFPQLRGIIRMPNVGHTPPEEQPAETTRIILDFLATL